MSQVEGAPETHEKKPVFEMTVSLGNVLQVLSVLIGVAVIYADLKADVARNSSQLAERTTRFEAIDQRLDRQDHTIATAINEIRAEIRLLRVDIRSLYNRDNGTNGGG